MAEPDAFEDNPLACPLVGALHMISGKWKPAILHRLALGTLRFGELQRRIAPISQKVLTQQLRELEGDGLVERTVYPEVPPRVEYRLSAKGESLCPILDRLHGWGATHSA